MPGYSARVRVLFVLVICILSQNLVEGFPSRAAEPEGEKSLGLREEEGTEHAFSLASSLIGRVKRGAEEKSEEKKGTAEGGNAEVKQKGEEATSGHKAPTAAEGKEAGQGEAAPTQEAGKQKMQGGRKRRFENEDAALMQLLSAARLDRQKREPTFKKKKKKGGGGGCCCCCCGKKK